METEIVNGIKVTWHSGKEATIQKMVNKLFEMLWNKFKNDELGVDIDGCKDVHQSAHEPTG